MYGDNDNRQIRRTARQAGEAQRGESREKSLKANGIMWVTNRHMWESETKSKELTTTDQYFLILSLLS
jgi:hypothetical protein